MLAFGTIGQRAWFAWKCLPRDPKGNPPAWRELEEKHGLSNGSLYKITWDFAKRPGFDQLEKLAAALNVTPQWLMKGTGPGPVAGWPIEPRPAPPERKLGKARSGPTLDAAVDAAFTKNAEKLVKRVRPARRDARK